MRLSRPTEALEVLLDQRRPGREAWAMKSEDDDVKLCSLCDGGWELRDGLTVYVCRWKA